MKKFIMILSALALIGASVVGVLNKKDFEAVSGALKVAKSEVTDITAKLGEAEDKREESTGKETQAKDTRNQAAAAVSDSEQKLKIVQRSLEEVSGELKKMEVEKKEIDLLVSKTFPDGNIKTSEDLLMTLTMLKDSLTEKQSKKTEYNAQLGTAAQAKQIQVVKVKEEEKYQMGRAQKLAVNGLVATVIAVNKEWGFVMVNAGRQHGVSADASLLVKRGNSRIARLRIVTLEDNSVVADLVDESLVSGLDVQPGDKVIFENAE